MSFEKNQVQQMDGRPTHSPKAELVTVSDSDSDLHSPRSLSLSLSLSQSVPQSLSRHSLTWHSLTHSLPLRCRPEPPSFTDSD